MKIPDDIRRAVTDTAEKVLEKGRQLGEEAGLQVQLKKLQVEKAKKIHELGKRTYEWYQGGNMVVSGPIPHDVVSLCAQLDETQKSMDDTQRQIEDARRAAASTPLLDKNPPPANSTPTSTPPALTPPDQGTGT